MTLLLAESALTEAFADELGTFAFGGAVVLVTLVIVIVSAIKSMTIARAKEQTKREIAAYIAEGTISPDDGIRLLTAGRDADALELITKSAADGWISTEKADQLIKSLGGVTIVKT